jgi:hypothetical protein
MLLSEKLELAIYTHVNAVGPLPVNVSLPHLSQVVGFNDHARIVECLKGLDADSRILLTKYSGGSRWSRREVNNDAQFFHSGSFLVEIAPQGRKYFEALEERVSRRRGP